MKLDIWTDGGARGNPGPAAIGIVIKNKDKIIYKHGEAIGHATNNVAEYTAVLKALEWLQNQIGQIGPISQIYFHLDSLLVVQQLKGLYKIKNAHLKILAYKVKQLEAKFNVHIAYNQIPREANTAADSLVNQALDNL